jgi:Domain of unknown function (DUF6458)
MNIGVSIFLITLGAILAFAVHVSTTGFDVNTVGVILLVVGGIWLLLTLILIANRRTAAARSSALVEERRIYDEPPLP